MVFWTVLCLAVAIVSGVLGFSGMAATSEGFVRILFVISLLLFVILVIASGAKGRRRR